MDCVRLKTGKYKLNSRTRDNYWIIERQDSVQLEINGKTGDTTLVKITWTAPCGYEMIITKSHRPATDTFLKRMERLPSVVKILDVTNDYYTFEAKKQGVPISLKDTIWIYHK